MITIQFIVALILIFFIAVLMTMVGRGGGNFYVLVLVIIGFTMHQAAATGQFIMFSAALGGMLIFQKHKSIAWPMAVFIGLTTSLMAFVGGAFAYQFTGRTLKFIFSGMLTMAGLIMLFPVR
jgi:uncharacterized membrane protein YfcA